VSWLSEFEDELTARGIRPAARERLVAEFADHLACEQGSSTRLELTRLGAAREIAGQYADELAADDARGGALAVFAALSCAAVALVVEQVTLGRVGYPGFNHGYSTALALLALAAVVFGSQVALVAGSLAAWRAVRRRREAVLPAAEIALLRRPLPRRAVGRADNDGRAAGLRGELRPACCRCGGWSSAARSPPARRLLWWRRGRPSCAARTRCPWRPGRPVTCSTTSRRCAACAAHPLRLCLLAALGTGGLVTLAEWHAEHSLAEGVQRGVFEALALTVCFALLGRAIGARR